MDLMNKVLQQPQQKLDMTREDYCSYELSKLLKEKGFDWDCIACYTTNGELKDIIHNTTGEVEECDWNNVSQTYLKVIGLASWYGNTSAPTHQTVMKWLRKKGIYVYVEPYIVGGTYIDELEVHYCGRILDTNRRRLYSIENMTSYPEAIEERIEYALESLI